MPADDKIAALSNPLSGKNKRGGFEKFESAIARYPHIPHVAVSSPAEILAALEKFERDNVTLIILNGGDGTLQTVLTYLQHIRAEVYQPKLVLLKAGTTSMAFGDVGCEGTLEDVLEQVAAYASGLTHNLNNVSRLVLRMHLPKTGQTVCGLFFGAGAIYSGILYCRQKLHTKGMRGELGPSLAMIRFLLDWATANKLTTPARAKIRIENEREFSGEFNIIVATTLHRLLMGVYPFWHKEEQYRHLALTIIKRNAPRPFKAFLNILRGHAPNVEHDSEYYQSYSPSVVTIGIENGFTLDGELFGESGVVTEVILDSAGAVSFLTT